MIAIKAGVYAPNFAAPRNYRREQEARSRPVKTDVRRHWFRDENHRNTYLARV